MSTALATLTSKLAQQFDMGTGEELSSILKQTAFKSGTQVTDAQMTALLVVANQYGLNPFTKEIFAFPDKGGIVPVVGVDGWARIMNNHPQFDGMEFTFSESSETTEASCTCTIYRKDRSHPVSATEYLAECKRDNSPAWKSHPRRMLRHKSMIQAARLAFGFGGIYDQDEAERIVEVDVTPSQQRVTQPVAKALPEITDDELRTLCADKVNDDGEITKIGYKSLVQSGQKTATAFIEWLSKKATVSDEVREIIEAWQPIEQEVAA